MKKIKLNTFSITFCIIGFILPIIGILLDNKFNYMVISGSSFLFAITLIYIYINRQEHISDLVLTPETLILQYRKFNKLCKEINIDISAINQVDISITKQISGSSIASTFPFQIEICFRGDNVHKNIYLQRGNYNIVFKIHKELSNIINNINIKAYGAHSNVIQADIDNYIKCGKRLSAFSRFMSTQNKQGKREIFIGIIILFLFFIFIIFMLVNYMSGSLY